jgi:hypothetical protein
MSNFDRWFKLYTAPAWILAKADAFDRGWSKVDFAKGIDRCFRFLEMTFLAALVGVGYSIVDPDWAVFARNLMSLGAGAYLGSPVATFLSRKSSERSLLVLAGISLIFGFSAMMIARPVQILISSTFQIDRATASKAYAAQKAHDAAYACARSHRWPPESCGEEARKEERRILRAAGQHTN